MFSLTVERLVREPFRTPIFPAGFATLYSIVLFATFLSGAMIAKPQTAQAMTACADLNAAINVNGVGGQNANFGNVVLQPGDVITILLQTSGQGGGVITVNQVTVGAQGFLGAARNLSDGVVEQIDVANNGSAVVQGDLVVSLTNNVGGAAIAISVTCVANNNVGGNGIGTSGEDASNQVSAVLTVTNPELNGQDLDTVFGVPRNLFTPLFEEAIRLQREGETAACIVLRQDIEALQGQLADARARFNSLDDAQQRAARLVESQKELEGQLTDLRNEQRENQESLDQFAASNPGVDPAEVRDRFDERLGAIERDLGVGGTLLDQSEEARQAEAQAAEQALEQANSEFSTAELQAIDALESKEGIERGIRITEEAARSIDERIQQNESSLENSSGAQEAVAINQEIQDLQDQITQKQGELTNCPSQSSLNAPANPLAAFSGHSAPALLASLNSGNSQKQVKEHTIHSLQRGSRQTENLRRTIQLAGTGNSAAISIPTGDQTRRSSLNARFDLRDWRTVQQQALTHVTLAGERLDPEVEDGRPLLKLPAFLADERLNIFGSTSISFSEDSAAGQDAFSYAVSGGISWSLTPTVNVGIAGRFQNADIDSATAIIDTNTWGLAGFVQTQFPVQDRPVRLAGTVAYSRSYVDNEFSNQGVVTTGDTVTQALSTQLKASTGFGINRYAINPFLSLSYNATDQEEFALSDGQISLGNASDQFSYSSGLSVGTSYQLSGGEIVLSPNAGFSAFGSFADDSNISFGLGGGMGIKTGTGLSGGVNVGVSGLTGNSRSISIGGSITLPLN